jgi:hypothetical protein
VLPGLNVTTVDVGGGIITYGNIIFYTKKIILPY